MNSGASVSATRAHHRERSGSGYTARLVSIVNIVLSTDALKLHRVWRHSNSFELRVIWRHSLKLRHRVWRHSNSIVSGGTQTPAPSCLEALKLSIIVSGGTIVTRRSGGGYTARQRVNHIGSSRHRIADARGTVVAGVGRSRHRTADARGTAQQQATEGGSRHRAADA